MTGASTGAAGAGGAGARGVGGTGAFGASAGGTGASGAGGAVTGGIGGGGYGISYSSCSSSTYGTHTMALRPSSVPQRVTLPSPSASTLPDVPGPEPDLARAACPTVTHVLATLVTDPCFASTAVSALVTELVDFASTCRIDYFASLISESGSDCPPSVGVELALGCDVLEERLFELECLAAAVPHFAAMLLAPEGNPDAMDIPSLGSYADATSDQYSSQWQTAMDA
ncbi:unnamed protein product [Closterium sp. NIES-54]